MSFKLKHIALALAIALVCPAALSGCSDINDAVLGTSSSSGGATDILKDATDYINKLSSYATKLSTTSSEFAEAISKSDTVSLKLKRDEMCKNLQECIDAEIPDLLKDEGGKYKQACENLKSVLSDYTDITCKYLEDKSSLTTEESKKIEELKTKYEEATKALEEANKSVDSKIESIKNPLKNSEVASGQSSTSNSSTEKQTTK